MSEHVVGYKRPPKASRFKPGQSGNPKGRPRREQPEIDRAEIFRRVALETIEIPTESRPSRMHRFEALIRRLRAMALNGDQSAVRLLEQLRKRYPAGAEQPSTIVFGIYEEDTRL